MARQALPVTPLTRAGTDLKAAGTAAVADGHFFGQSPRRMLRITNSATAARTVSAQIPGTVDGQEIGDRAYAIPASGDVLIPPFPAVYRQPNGNVHLDYDNSAGVFVTVLELPA